MSDEKVSPSEEAKVNRNLAFFKKNSENSANFSEKPAHY
jgi:hypothetical protein